MEIPRGRGVLINDNFLEAMYENKLEFPRGVGGAKQKPSVGEYGYFLELHNRDVCMGFSIFENLYFVDFSPKFNQTCLKNSI